MTERQGLGESIASREKLPALNVDGAMFSTIKFNLTAKDDRYGSATIRRNTALKNGLMS